MASRRNAKWTREPTTFAGGGGYEPAWRTRCTADGWERPAYRETAERLWALHQSRRERVVVRPRELGPGENDWEAWEYAPPFPSITWSQLAYLGFWTYHYGLEQPLGVPRSVYRGDPRGTWLRLMRGFLASTEAEVETQLVLGALAAEWMYTP